MTRSPYPDQVPDQVDDATQYDLSIDEWVDKQAKGYIDCADDTADLYLGGTAE